MERASVKVTVHGHVTGIGFRAFASARARRLGLTGYARNLPDGSAVEIEAEGDRHKLEQFLGYLKTGPPLARLDKVEISWGKYAGRYTDFSIP